MFNMNNNMFPMNRFNFNNHFIIMPHNNGINRMNLNNNINPIFNMNLNNNMGLMPNLGNFPQNNINVFGGLNNFNFNKIISPVKSIYNYNSSQMNYSYANTVLQCLAGLRCIREWYTQLTKYNFIQINNNQNSITRLFYNIIFFLNSGNFPDSSIIINQYFQKVWQLHQKQPKSDPFHFLFYFLELFHLENNNIVNPNFNINQYLNPTYNNLMNDQYMLTLFQNYFKSTQSSIVSNNFFNVLRYVIKCNNPLMHCPPLYRYKATKILQFNVDQVKNHRDQIDPLRMGNNINLVDCFSYWQKGENAKCDNCGGYVAKSISSLWNSNKVLIFSFNRNFHSFNGDIDFGTRIDMRPFCKFNMHGNLTNIYNLRACVSAYNFNKYFADVRINGNWFRFMDGQCKTLDNSRNEIFLYEPQLLIYELEEAQNSLYMNNIQNNNFFNPFNMMNFNQMLRNVGNNNLMMNNFNFLRGF